jgi:hypothetical protein
MYRSPGLSLRNLTHQFPEWKCYEAQLMLEEVSRVEMSYADFLANPPEGVDAMTALTEQEQQDLLEDLEEIASFEELWR